MRRENSNFLAHSALRSIVSAARSNQHSPIADLDYPCALRNSSFHYPGIAFVAHELLTNGVTKKTPLVDLAGVQSTYW